MQHTGALKRFLDIFRRDSKRDDQSAFAGPTLLDQEPELAHEVGRHGLAA